MQNTITFNNKTKISTLEAAKERLEDFFLDRVDNTYIWIKEIEIKPEAERIDFWFETLDTSFERELFNSIRARTLRYLGVTAVGYFSSEIDRSTGRYTFKWSFQPEGK